MIKGYHYSDHLSSARLHTRFLTSADVLPWMEFTQDPDAIELFPTFGLINAEERARQWIERQLSRYTEHRYGLQMLVHTQTDQIIGQAGLMLQEIGGVTEIEVGYHILQKFWGQGYAPEAAKLFLEYAFTNDLADTVVSIIDIRNAKSIRVAEKNHLLREGQIKWMGLDVYMYRIHKNQFALNRPTTKGIR